MKLVRIGWRVFNLDQLVTAKVVQNEEVTLYFAAPEGAWEPSEGQVSPFFERLTGSEAEAFCRWLKHNCETVIVGQ